MGDWSEVRERYRTGWNEVESSHPWDSGGRAPGYLIFEIGGDNPCYQQLSRNAPIFEPGTCIDTRQNRNDTQPHRTCSCLSVDELPCAQMSAVAAVSLLVFYPLLMNLPLNLVRFQWGFKRGLAPMSPGVQKQAEAADRMVLYVSYFILLAVVVALLNRSRFSVYAVGLTIGNWKSAIALGALSSLLFVGLESIVPAEKLRGSGISGFVGKLVRFDCARFAFSRAVACLLHSIPDSTRPILVGCCFGRRDCIRSVSTIHNHRNGSWCVYRRGCRRVSFRQDRFVAGSPNHEPDSSGSAFLSSEVHIDRSITVSYEMRRLLSDISSLGSRSTLFHTQFPLSKMRRAT